MPAGVRIELQRRPSAIAVMLHALRPSPKLLGAGSFSSIRAVWRQHQIDQRHLAEFLRITGLQADNRVPILYPHALGFRLQMSVLTHPSFPIPIWRALQIRNHLLQHQPISANSVLDFETTIASKRILEKALEVDLHTTVYCAGELAWESLNTFYYRGRFGIPEPISPLAPPPEVGGAIVAAWRTPLRTRWKFSRMTGDYNGVHLWNWYARLFSFRRAFHHPQRVLGQCMAHMPALNHSATQRLDAWLKGPVYYDSAVQLKARAEPDSVRFALTVGKDDRPAVLGHWQCGPAIPSRILDTPGSQ